MIFLHSQIIGLPIGSIEDRAKVGVVCDIVIGPDDGTVLGLLVKTNPLDFRSQVVSWQDIRDIDKNGAVIANKDAMVTTSEILRIDDLLRDNFSLIGLPVQTLDNVNLGSIYDYEADFKVGAITKIFCSALLGKKRIIGRSKIIRIDRDKVIVRSAALGIPTASRETRHAVA